MKKLGQYLKQKFMAAPVDKMIPAIFVVIALLSGTFGVAIGASFGWSAYAGVMVAGTTLWWFLRKARMQRERAAALTTEGCK